MGWTPETLKQYIDSRVQSIEDEIQRRFFAGAQALDKAELALERRLETMNEFRAQLYDERSNYVGRREFDEVKKTVDRGAGARTAIIGVAAVLVTTLALVLGITQQSQLTHGQVSDQIARESPWFTDKPIIESRLNVLDHQVASLQARLAASEALNRVLCRRSRPAC